MGIRIGRLALLTAVVGCVSTSHAAEWVRYTFNDGLITPGMTVLPADVVGANTAGTGTNTDISVVDPTGLGQIAGGLVNLSNNNGRSSQQHDPNIPDPTTNGQGWINGTATGTFLEIANSSFANAAFYGTQDAVSIEMWVTVQENRNWARVWDIGTSNGGENVSNGGSDTAYTIGVPQRDGGGFAASTKSPVGPAGGAEEEFYVRQPVTPLATGVEHHIVFTIDQTPAAKAIEPNGVATLYLNGIQVATGPVHNGNEGLSPFSASNLNDNNAWFGRAQWGDPLFDGWYNEIRIYDNAITSSDVSANFAAGPTPALLPVVTIDRATGNVSIANDSGTPLQVTGYTLTSAAGGLDTAGFSSIQNSAGGTWSTSPLTNTQITQSSVAGSSIADDSAAGIGMAWLQSPIQDIFATVSLADGTHTGALVTYIGNALSPLDLDFDGNLDIDDFEIFADYAYTDLTGLSLVEQVRRGDLDRDGDNDYVDFRAFKNQYNALNGLGAFEAMLAAGSVQVPEPSGVMLCGLAAVGFLAARRRSLPMSNLFARKVLAVVAVVVSLTFVSRSQAVVIMDFDPSRWSGVGEAVGDANWEGESWFDSVVNLEAIDGASTPASTNGHVPLKTNGQLGMDPFADWIEFSYSSFDVNSTTHPLVGKQEFTIAAVVRVPVAAGPLAPNVPENNFYQHNGFAGKEVGGAGVGDWNLGLVQVAGDQRAHIVGGTALGANDIGTAGPAIDDDQWHTVHFVVDNKLNGTFDQLLYLDGVLVASDLAISYGGLNPAIREADFSIGARRGGDNGYLRDADLARLQFSDTALTQAEITKQASTFIGEGLKPLQVVIGPGNSLSIENPNSEDDISIDAYFVTSETGGSFNVSNWNSLENQGIDAGSGAPDGDFNNDGSVNLADYTVWRDNLGNPAGLTNDGDLVGPVNAAYYDLWKQNFGATGGEEDGGWFELSGAASDTQLGEYFFGDASTLAAGNTWSLGNAFTGSGVESLTFMYSQNGVLREGSVVVGAGSLQAAAIPEPTSAFLVLTTVGMLAGIRLRSRLQS